MAAVWGLGLGPVPKLLVFGTLLMVAQMARPGWCCCRCG